MEAVFPFKEVPGDLSIPASPPTEEKSLALILNVNLEASYFIAPVLTASSQEYGSKNSSKDQSKMVAARA